MKNCGTLYIWLGNGWGRGSEKLENDWEFAHCQSVRTLIIIIHLFPYTAMSLV